MTHWKIRYPAAIVIMFAVAISGCADTINTTWVTERLGETEAHWIGPAIRIERPLLLGEIRDPKTTGGMIVIRSAFTGLVLFRETALTAIDAYETPFIPRNQIENFGPKAGDPVGIYYFQLRARPNAQCAEYDQAMVAADQSFNQAQHLFDPPAPADYCITYRYAGPLTNLAERYILATYMLGEALDLDYNVEVTELRRGERDVLARQVTCSRFRNGPAAPSCPSRNTLLSLLHPR